MGDSNSKLFNKQLFATKIKEWESDIFIDGSQWYYVYKNSEEDIKIARYLLDGGPAGTYSDGYFACEFDVVIKSKQIPKLLSALDSGNNIKEALERNLHFLNDIGFKKFLKDNNI
jgi:hypothetical protein